MHQRLDRDTSGVVLFAIDPRANEGLARAFAGREVEKTYLALRARRRLRRGDGLRGLGAARRPGPAVRRPGEGGGPGAKPAETEVVVREVLADALLVEARPLTGRKHQVRAHLAHAGLPILGRRGLRRTPGDGAPRLMLHAWRLALPHPLTGRRLASSRARCPRTSSAGASTGGAVADRRRRQR